MPGLAPFAPAIAGLLLGTGGMVAANAESKAAIKNAQNATATASAQETTNQGNAQSGLAGMLKNPPATAPGGVTAPPAYNGAAIPIAGAPRAATPGPGMMSVRGSGVTPSGAAPPAAGSQLPPAVLAMLKQAISGQA
jgi:hypothetical protein